MLGVIAGTDWVTGGAAATTAPFASTICVVSVTCCGDAVSLRTLVCTATTAESAFVVVVVEGTIETVATWVPQPAAIMRSRMRAAPLRSR